MKVVERCTVLLHREDGRQDLGTVPHKDKTRQSNLILCFRGLPVQLWVLYEKSWLQMPHFLALTKSTSIPKPRKQIYQICTPLKKVSPQDLKLQNPWRSRSFSRNPLNPKVQKNPQPAEALSAAGARHLRLRPR